MIPYRVTGGRTAVPYVTWFILVLSSVLFLSQIIQESFDEYVYVLTVVPPLFSLTELKDWLNVGAALFIYESFFHLITGLWFLWVFGSWVEKQFGHVLYFLIFLASGVVSILLEWHSDPAGRLAIVASSTAVSGIMGTFLAIGIAQHVESVGLRRLQPDTFYTWAWVWPGVWLLMQMVNNVFFVETINFDIKWSGTLYDVVGLTVGMLSGLLLKRPLARFYTWLDASE